MERVQTAVGEYEQVLSGCQGVELRKLCPSELNGLRFAVIRTLRCSDASVRFGQLFHEIVDLMSQHLPFTLKCLVDALDVACIFADFRL